MLSLECANFGGDLALLDNLRIHTLGALYEVFEPQEARRIAHRLAFHFTPKHGNWLNMAEIDFSILSWQCLKRRVPDIPTLRRDVTARADDRNTNHAIVNCRFSLTDARTDLG